MRFTEKKKKNTKPKPTKQKKTQKPTKNQTNNAAPPKKKKQPKSPKTNWKHSKCFAENKPSQGLGQPEPLKAAGRPNSPNSTERLNGSIAALRPRQAPGDGHAPPAPPGPPRSPFWSLLWHTQPSRAAWPSLFPLPCPQSSSKSLKQFGGSF